MNFSKICNALIALLLVMALFSSCSQDEMMDLGPETENFTPNMDDPSEDPNDSEDEDSDDEDSDDEDDDDNDSDIFDFDDCIELVYPVTLIFPDGTTSSILDEDALEDEIEAWYDLNPDAIEPPTFEYPIDVILNDGTQSTISDQAALEGLISNCSDEEYTDEFEEDCFTIVFPASFVLPDGTEHTANDIQEAEDIIVAFYDANPDISDEPEIIYPVTIEYDDGTTSEITTEEDWEDAEDICED